MQGGKLMTAGEGGCLLTNDAELENAAWEFHNCGRERGKWFYHHRTRRLEHADDGVAGRGAAGAAGAVPGAAPDPQRERLVLNEALAEIPGIRPQPRDERMDVNGNYCFIFHYDASEFAGVPLREFEAALEAEGIPMGVSYPSLGDLELFAGDDRPAVPVAVDAAATTVWLEHRCCSRGASRCSTWRGWWRRCTQNAALLAARSATV